MPQNSFGFILDDLGDCSEREIISYQPPEGIQPDTWYHITAVADYPNNLFKLFIDGNLTATGIWDKTPIDKDMLVTIGMFRDGCYSDSYFAGIIDEVYIYNRVLSESEILKLYNVNTWNFHSLATGDAPQWTGWFYGQANVDAAGNSTVTLFQNSDGDTTQPPTTTLNIAPDGIITNQSIPSYHGALSLDRKLVVVTMTNSGPDGSHVFQIVQKAGGTFTTSDLQGTWNYHNLVSGDSPQWTGWYYGQAAVDAGGNVTQISFLNSDGDTTLPPNNTIAIASDGIVTEVGGSFHGAMNIRKDVIAGVINDGGGGYSIQIAQKAGGTFAINDLAGAWNFHTIVSGDAPQWTGWERGRGIIDAVGNLTVTSFLDSDGSTTSFSNITLAITSDGLITEESGSSFHGTMNIEKDLIVGTTNDADGGYKLFVMQKTCTTGNGLYGWLLGDINEDCIVDISDVILVLRMALDLDDDVPCADINGDGIVDISDVILTLRMALGLDPLQQCNSGGI